MGGRGRETAFIFYLKKRFFMHFKSLLVTYFSIYIKGFCMGIADLIPGVSGGTIAFLFGIYEELLNSIKSFNIAFFQSCLRLRLKEAFTQTGWKFLTALLCGILTAVFTLSHTMKWLLNDFPVQVHGFFFGLIVATVWVIGKKIQNKDFAKIGLGLASAWMMFVLVGMIPIQTPETWWFVCFSGALAICAMILPGISGAFILLLLGKYDYIIHAVSARDFFVLAVFSVGCGIGLLGFVHILSWFLKKYYDLTLTVLTGLVLGSLRKIWPWKETLSTMVTSRGKIVPIEQMNVLPKDFDLEFFVTIALICAGFALSFLIARFDTDGRPAGRIPKISKTL